MSKTKNWTMEDLIKKGIAEKEPGIFSKSNDGFKREFVLPTNSIAFDNALKAQIGRPAIDQNIEYLNLQRTNSVFIAGNVPSKKNGMCFTCVNGKPVKYPADKMKRYEKESEASWIANKQKFQSLIFTMGSRLDIEFTFVRKTKQLFDYLGPAETAQDYMVKHGYITDDNFTIIRPFFGIPLLDKNNPGLIIKILNK